MSQLTPNEGRFETILSGQEDFTKMSGWGIVFLKHLFFFFGSFLNCSVLYNYKIFFVFFCSICSIFFLEKISVKKKNVPIVTTWPTLCIQLTVFSRPEWCTCSYDFCSSDFRVCIHGLIEKTVE